MTICVRRRQLHAGRYRQSRPHLLVGSVLLYLCLRSLDSGSPLSSVAGCFRGRSSHSRSGGRGTCDDVSESSSTLLFFSVSPAVVCRLCRTTLGTGAVERSEKSELQSTMPPSNRSRLPCRKVGRSVCHPPHSAPAPCTPCSAVSHFPLLCFFFARNTCYASCRSSCCSCWCRVRGNASDATAS